MELYQLFTGHVRARPLIFTTSNGYTMYGYD